MARPKKVPPPGIDELKELLRGSGLRATRPRIAVLQCLHDATVPKSHGDLVEELAREGYDRATIYRNLTDLAESGIVDTDRVGRSVVVTLNHEHLAVPSLTELGALRLRLVERLTSHLADWPPILDAAWLFGSAARGDGGRDSDIDILLVASRLDDPRWDHHTDELRHVVERWTGNPAQLVEYDEDAFAALVASDAPLVVSQVIASASRYSATFHLLPQTRQVSLRRIEYGVYFLTLLSIIFLLVDTEILDPGVSSTLYIPIVKFGATTFIYGCQLLICTYLVPFNVVINARTKHTPQGRFLIFSSLFPIKLCR